MLTTSAGIHEQLKTTRVIENRVVIAVAPNPLASRDGFSYKCPSSPPIFNLNNKNVYEKGIVRDPEGQYTPTTPTSMHWVGCVTVQIRKWVRRGHHTPLRSAPKIYHIFYLNLF